MNHPREIPIIVIYLLCPVERNAPIKVRGEKDMFSSIFQETMTEENWTKFQNAVLKNTPILFPLGYAENPSGCKNVSRHVEDMICLQVDDIVKKIDGFISKK